MARRLALLLGGVMVAPLACGGNAVSNRQGHGGSAGCPDAANCNPSPNSGTVGGMGAKGDPPDVAEADGGGGRGGHDEGGALMGGWSASSEGGAPPSAGSGELGGAAGSNEAGSADIELGGAGGSACVDADEKVSSCGYQDQGTRTQSCVDGTWGAAACRVAFGNVERFSQLTVNELLLQRVSIPTDSTLDKLGILATGNGFGAFSLALYTESIWSVGDEVHHEPGPLFAGATTTLTPSGSGAFEIDLPDQPLPAGFYWIAYAVDYNGGVGYKSPDASALGMCVCNETYGSFTEPFSWYPQYACISKVCSTNASINAYVVTTEP